jgi:hypothetical protein
MKEYSHAIYGGEARRYVLVLVLSIREPEAAGNGGNKRLGDT